MATPQYKLIEGSAAEAFRNSRMKIAMYGGGFANGKTTALVMDGLRVAIDYPGCSMMFGRDTYQNLNKTLRREFFKWCPKTWVKSFNQKDNTVVLVNDTIIDFRYISMRENEDGEGTSNLLSANYDYIAVDQIDDVSITRKDFDHLLGRLRGNTPYEGDDATMPVTGPRWLRLACNPTLSWVYTDLVKPVHDLREGRINEKLICVIDEQTKAPLIVNGSPVPLIEVFEASTYENAQNLAADYIQTLEATYTGTMKDRYLYGKWKAFEGVVYDEYDPDMHRVPEEQLRNHIRSLQQSGFQLEVREAYDFGIAAKNCYLLALVDDQNTTYVVDGFYKPNMMVKDQAEEIKRLRAKWLGKYAFESYGELELSADPSIFRNSNAGHRTVGMTVADMFRDEGIAAHRANNAILNGIVKVKAYLNVQATKINPFTHAYGCPRLFVSDALHWWHDEAVVYRWKKSRDEQAVDAPVDRKNDAMDATRYLLTRMPDPAQLLLHVPKFVRRLGVLVDKRVTKWAELPDTVVNTDRRNHRYG